MNENNQLTMWSSSSIDLENVGLVLDQESKNKFEFEPTPYTFATLDNGKRGGTDSSPISPPSWLLLDHTIAVIWSMFSQNPCLQQLSIDDLKWAYEFLKDIKNKKGENPPDVKVCLKEIQDRLISLYAKLVSLKDEDFDEIAAAFGEKIMADSTSSYLNTYSLIPACTESKLDTTSICSSISPSKTTIKLPFSSIFNHSSKDITLGKNTGNTRHKTIAMNYSKKTFPLIKKNSNIFEEPENVEDEEVEKYILSLFEDDKKDLQLRSTPKSCIPTKRKTPGGLSYSEMIATQDAMSDVIKKEKTSKKVHCVAEMRSLKFQKSMKVQDTNGEEAAFSNLKAEIRRLTIDPNVSRDEIMKFLKDWRSEQVERLQNELKRLNSIEEFMKSVGTNGFEPNLRLKSPTTLKELETTDSKNALRKKL